MIVVPATAPSCVINCWKAAAVPMSSGSTALDNRPVMAGPATPRPTPVSARPTTITTSDEPTPTELNTNIEMIVAEAPMTPLERSPMRRVMMLAAAATIENVSGRAMISQPMCDVE